MEQSMNRMTYRYNEKANQLVEIKPHSKDVNLDNEASKSMNVIPKQQATPIVWINEPEHKLEKEQPLSLSENVVVATAYEETSWPDLEQLEALIRDKDRDFHEEVKDTTQEVSLENESDTLQETNNQAGYQPYIDNPITSSSNMQWQPQLEAEELVHMPYRRSTRSESSSYWIWGKLMISVLSSVITGVLIGYVLLLAVFGTQIWPISTLTGASDATGQNHVGKSQEESNNAFLDISPTILDTDVSTSGPNANNGNADQQLILSEKDALAESTVIHVEQNTDKLPIMQRFQYVVLQAGIFSKADTRDALIQDFNKKGYPTSFLQNQKGQYIVLSGLAVTADDAKILAQAQPNVELYRKTIDLDVPVLADQEDLDQQLQQWVFDTHTFMQSYMQLVAAQYEQGSFSAIHKDSESVLIESYNKWLSQTEQLSALTLPKEILDRLEKIQSTVSSLHNSFLDYQKQPKAEPLKQITQHLLTLIANQYEWFHA